MVLLRIGPVVRAISSTSAVIWAEFSQACTVTCRATPSSSQASDVVSIQVSTVTVGGRFFAAPQLPGLRPATWYTYDLAMTTIDEQTRIQTTFPLQCFRTLNQPSSAQTAAEKYTPLRVAYGSCRKSNLPQSDALHAFGDWLLRCAGEREERWPHILLLIGDQIYADEPPDKLLKMHPHLRQGVRSFADFALLYEYAWTYDESVRQALAVLPTLMIFDDHEITNNWNTAPSWRAGMLQAGMEQMLVDGLVAYWVYQGWGNLCQRDEARYPLLHIMEEAAQSGDDALAALRRSIKDDVYGTHPLNWHYEIPTEPAIFVTNARTERTAVFTDKPEEMYAPTRIVSKRQMAELRDWLHGHDTGIALLVSSVPVLLPPLIGLAEYLMGQRFWQEKSAPLRESGLKLAQQQQRIASRASFDHWPFYNVSWHELVQLLSERARDIVVLSGDVHFSYAVAAQSRKARSKEPAYLYQLVSTPLQNALSESDRRLIELQSSLAHSSYGGLSTHVLPLTEVNTAAHTRRNLLFDNTLALVTLQPTPEDTYTIQQEYLGVIDGQMEVLGRTHLP